MNRFTREETVAKLEDAPEFVKTAPTRMARIEGPFEVLTMHGWVICADGWLAIDSAGWPYPVDVDVQSRTYRPYEPEGTVLTP